MAPNDCLLDCIYFIKPPVAIPYGPETIQNRVKRCYERDRRKREIERESEDNHVGKTKFLETSKAFPQHHMREQWSRCLNPIKKCDMLSARSKDVYKYHSRVCLSLLYNIPTSGV